MVQLYSEAPGFTAKDAELAELFHQRRQIDARIREILGTDLTKPVWGPCTRCGYVWNGKWAKRRPRHCARCHSSGWDMPIIQATNGKRKTFPPAGMPQSRMIAQPPRLSDVVAKLFPAPSNEPPQPERAMQPAPVPTMDEQRIDQIASTLLSVSREVL